MIKYPWDIKSCGYFILKKNKQNFLCELFDFKDYLYIERFLSSLKTK